MSLRPLSQKSSSISDEDLRIAQELERQILEAQIWPIVEPIVREVTKPFVNQPLSEETVLEAQQALDARLVALGPDFPLPGVELALKRDPNDPYTLLLELKDG